MQHEQINIFALQIPQRVIERAFHVVWVEGIAPEFCGEEDIGARDAAFLDGFADVFFGVVAARRSLSFAVCIYLRGW